MANPPPLKCINMSLSMGLEQYSHRLDKWLVGMTGENRFEAVNINRSSDSKQIRMTVSGVQSLDIVKFKSRRRRQGLYKMFSYGKIFKVISKMVLMKRHNILDIRRQENDQD